MQEEVGNALFHPNNASLILYQFLTMPLLRFTKVENIIKCVHNKWGDLELGEYNVESELFAFFTIVMSNMSTSNFFT